MRIHECPYRSKCINTFGSYTCRCPKGYKMKDNACEGIFFVQLVVFIFIVLSLTFGVTVYMKIPLYFNM